MNNFENPNPSKEPNRIDYSLGAKLEGAGISTQIIRDTVETRNLTNLDVAENDPTTQEAVSTEKKPRERNRQGGNGRKADHPALAEKMIEINKIKEDVMKNKARFERDKSLITREIEEIQGKIKEAEEQNHHDVIKNWSIRLKRAEDVLSVIEKTAPSVEPISNEAIIKGLQDYHRARNAQTQAEIKVNKNSEDERAKGDYLRAQAEAAAIKATIEGLVKNREVEDINNSSPVRNESISYTHEQEEKDKLEHQEHHKKTEEKTPHNTIDESLISTPTDVVEDESEKTIIHQSQESNAAQAILSEREIIAEKEIIYTPIDLEAALKNIASIEKAVEKRAEKAGMSEKALNIMRSVGETYQKWPLKKKLLVSVALIAVAATGSGGIAGIAIGGTLIQRALGGLAIFTAAEGALKASAEKDGRERDEWEKRRHTTEALIAGILVGGGVLGHAIHNVLTETIPSVHKVPEVSTESTEPNVSPSNEYAGIAEAGDSRWSLAERALAEGPYADQFNSIASDEQRTYIINALKDKITEGMTPEEANTLSIGEKIDFKEIFADKDFMGSVFSGEHTGNIVETPEVAAPQMESPAVIDPLPVETIPQSEVLVDATQMEAYADGILYQDIDKIFGTSRFFGFGHINGVDSIDWKDPDVGFAGKTIDDVMNAKPSTAPTGSDRVFGIENNDAVEKMKLYLTNVRHMARINPEAGENIADFIRRAAATNATLSS